MGQEGETYARMANLVPCALGMQGPRRDHSPVQKESVVREVETAEWCDVTGAVSAEGRGAGGRALYAGPHSPVPAPPPEVQCGLHAGLPEGEECRADSPRTLAGAARDGLAFVGGWLLCEPGGLDEAQVRPYLREPEEVERRQGELALE